MITLEKTYSDGNKRTLNVDSAAYANAEHTALILSLAAGGGAIAVTADDATFWQLIHQSALTIAPFAMSLEEVKALYERAVQRHMDGLAFAAGYDDIKTAVTYADEPAVAKFQQEGQAFRAWRSLCWAYCYEQLAAVEANQRPQPTVEELLGELPALLLPAA